MLLDACYLETWKKLYEETAKIRTCGLWLAEWAKGQGTGCLFALQALQFDFLTMSKYYFQKSKYILNF